MYMYVFTNNPNGLVIHVHVCIIIFTNNLSGLELYVHVHVHVYKQQLQWLRVIHVHVDLYQQPQWLIHVYTCNYIPVYVSLPIASMA